MYNIGPEHAFRTFPAPVEIEGHQYFLVRGNLGYRLFSNVCPHQGGLVVPSEACFECPEHGWRFDLQTGQCVSGPAAHLSGFPVTVQAGRLMADVPPALPFVHPLRPRDVEWPADLRMRLVGHASLEIQYAGFTLLTDPWLSGPAFLGAWVTYPGSRIDPSTIRPDAIWISHEHSDHFHKPTLAKFSRQTPIYIPAFPNGRLERELAEMGFANVQPMQFGRRYEVGSGFRLTCFEPPGLWNDSVVLIEIGEVRLLNINDAGVNHRIASVVGPVDILTSAFSPASSYPAAWTHVSPDEKAHISERARLGMLRMLHHAVKRYQPRYLLPFASHFALWHPAHREFERQIRRNTLDDVVHAFRRSPVHVIDMLPGGSWEPASGVLDRGPDRSGLYAKDRMQRWLEDTFDPAVFAQHHPPSGPLHRHEVEAYVQRLNDVPDIAFCEDATVTFEGVEGDRVAIDASVQIMNGRLSVLRQRPATPNLTIRMPVNILRYIIVNNASWDEAHVGFWCQFTRTPDVFSAGLWRLLQAPYYVRPGAEVRTNGSTDIAAHANVAELIEQYGSRAERILGRYGLYCGGCAHASAESVMRAAARHGVPPATADRLIRELNVVLRAAPESGSVPPDAR